MTTRRRFLGQLAAAVGLTALGDRILGLGPTPASTPLPPLEPIRLIRTTGRIEITEEVLEKVRPNRRAFEEWAEKELPLKADELSQLLRGEFERTVIPELERARELSSYLEAIDVEPAEGRYLEFSL